MRDDAVVLIVEDECDLADSLRGLLASEAIVSEVFFSGESALRDAQLERVGCAILDVQLPGISGLELQRLLRERGANFPVIVISGHATVQETVCAFENGVFRFFEKPVDPGQLLRAVNEAINSELERRRAHGIREHRLATLTERESEVLNLLLQDKATKQIARELGISSSTVEKHRAKILAKFDVTSVVGLATYCLSVRPPFNPPTACQASDLRIARAS